MTSTLVFDHRFRARRIAVRRAQGRRRLRRLVTLAIVFTLAVTALGVSRSFLLDVDAIGVAGAERSSTESIVVAAGIVPGDQLTDVDLDAARAAIGALPWIDSVAIERDWWGTIDITVVERQPVAAVADSTDRWWLVDSDAKLLAPVAEPESRFVRLEGLEVTGTAGSGVGDARALPAVLAAVDFPADLLARTDSFRVVGDGGIELAVRTGAPGEVVDVLMGQPLDIAEKAMALRTILARVVPDCIRTIDVRVPASPVVVRWPEIVAEDGEAVRCDPR
ncbi:MAG: FtsQ-type POTRA domain-containing protein [Actinomycetia bacterium]|nr:FtsQ-type POTRA domain-containing protein [Actinomycetes bacterium]